MTVTTLETFKCVLTPLKPGQQCRPHHAKACAQALVCGGRSLVMVGVALRYAWLGLHDLSHALPGLVVAARCALAHRSTTLRTVLASLRLSAASS